MSSASVADRSSNKNEQIVHAAEVIGRSKYRAEVFRRIYTGKSKTKAVSQLVDATGFQPTKVLDAGKALADGDIVVQTKVNRRTAYQKVEFFQRYRDRILKYAGDRKAREAIPTKRAPRPRGQQAIRIAVELRTPKRNVKAQRITVDDVDTFKAVRRVPDDQPYTRISEKKFKNGVAAILGERAIFNDWGGELRDLSSTRLRIGGVRRAAAVAFKGPGTKGRLTPGKLGKNGDQIQRLARCPADVFLIQYWGEIDDAVQEQLEKFIQAKAYFENRPLWYGVIDGQDSTRIIQAYPSKFP